MRLSMAVPPSRPLPGHAVRRSRQSGFTLIELLVVLAIMASATAGASLALRDSDHVRIEREADRLAALLEAARAQSRASGIPVRWQPSGEGFAFTGLPETSTLPLTWLEPTIVVSGGTAQALRSNNILLVLGPEPVLPAQTLTIAIAGKPQVQRTLATDGVRPFRPVAAGVAP